MQVFPVAYQRYVRGLRPDVKVLNWNETLFPECTHRLKKSPGKTQALLEMDYLRESGGVLFVPEMRKVQSPFQCVDWGLTYRWWDSSALPPIESPSLELFRQRITTAEVSDPESQEALSVLYLKEASRSAARGDFPGAVAKLQQVEKDCAESANALVNAAVLYLRLREIPRAEALLRMALDQRPHHYTANVDLGIVYASRGDREGAQRCFEVAAAAVPGNPEAAFYLKSLQSALLPKGEAP